MRKTKSTSCNLNNFCIHACLHMDQPLVFHLLATYHLDSQLFYILETISIISP